LRPIRKRLIEYLVSDKERKEEKEKINFRFKFNECLIELYKRQYCGLYDPLKRSGQYNEKRTELRLKIEFAYYIYEKYDEDGVCINDPEKKLIEKDKYLEIYRYSQILYDKKIINYRKEVRYMTYDRKKKLVELSVYTEVELSVYTQLEDSRFW
jgi:hypothetical protein